MNKEDAKRVLIKAQELKRAKDDLMNESLGSFIELFPETKFLSITANNHIFVRSEYLFDLAEAFKKELEFFFFPDGNSCDAYIEVENVIFYSYIDSEKTKNKFDALLWELAAENR